MRRLERILFFFFSSRRRHTRLQGDWSSDVCSSDLVFLATFLLAVMSLILLSATAVQHRLIRPLIDRPRFKTFASRQILAGAVTLAIALISGTQLVLSTIFGHFVGSIAAEIGRAHV